MWAVFARLADENRLEMAATLRGALTANLDKWRAQLAEGELAGTHIGGIAGKAAGQFEDYFREALARYCSRFAIDYDAEVRIKLGEKGKALADLTLGQMIQCSDILNERLTRCLRSETRPLGQHRAARRLVSQRDRALLGKINRMRVTLVHSRQEYDRRLLGNTCDLVAWVSQAMALPFFEFSEFNES